MTTANLAVSDNEAVVQYESAGEASFVYPFPILDSAELKVSVNQVLKTLGVDYSISGVGDAGGGSITFTSATTAGQLITLWLEMPIKRLTGFQLGAAALMPEALNSEFVRQVRIDQMLRRDIGRALHIPVDDPEAGQDLELPTASERAGKFLRFADGTGNPEVALTLEEGQQTLSQSVIAAFLNPRTLAEQNAGLAIADYTLPVGYVERYSGAKTTILQALLDSTIPEIFCLAGATYTLTARITLASNKRIKVYGGHRKVNWDFPGVLGVSSGESFLVYGTGISNLWMEDVHVIGDATAFINNGFDTYGVLITASSNCHLRRVSAEGCENGVHMRNGCSDCSMVDVEGIDCFYHAVASWGLDSAPNVRMKLHNLRGYSTGATFKAAAISGVFIEETYDSDLLNLTGHDVRIGVRMENLADNEIANVRGYSCWQSGVILYNLAQRNNVVNVRAWDNNRVNQDAIDTTIRGNDNTFFSGFDVSVGSDNNNIANILAFQTKGTKIPFNSGSAEPWLGSLIRGATSGATARVRRVELTSGSWGGGNAAGVLHCCEASGAFNAAEVIGNRTTRIPYTSGSAKPDPGDVLEGATSGATGTVLWASQQSDNTTDWSVGNSEGFIYLVEVTGTFDNSEQLDNTTTGANNIAETDGAGTAAAADVATTNGATSLGHENADGTYGRGFQKYGIGINTRNLEGAVTADGHTLISNWQAFNNDIAPVSDRGLYTRLSSIGNVDVFGITRNA